MQQFEHELRMKQMEMENERRREEREHEMRMMTMLMGYSAQPYFPGLNRSSSPQSLQSDNEYVSTSSAGSFYTH